MLDTERLTLQWIKEKFVGRVSGLEFIDCKFFFLCIIIQDVELMKKEKESLDSQLRSMGINPPPGPAYIPTPAEMRPGPSLSFIGQDNMLSIRDRSLTTESFAGDLSEGMFVSTKDGPKTKPTVRIRSSSESEGTENKANSQQSTKVSFEFEFVVSRDKS